jgi:hypothetical protein
MFGSLNRKISTVSIKFFLECFRGGLCKVKLGEVGTVPCSLFLPVFLLATLLLKRGRRGKRKGSGSGSGEEKLI